MPWNGHMAVVNVTQACNELPDMVDRVQDGGGENHHNVEELQRRPH